METYLNISQILISVVLVIVVLLQVREQGGGMFGGGGQASYRTRRGLEKTLFQFTIILVVIFIGISILSATAEKRGWFI